MKTFTKLLALAAAIAGLAQVAQAVPQLRISDGINPDVTITDNIGADVQPTAGQVVWVGSIGNWTLNVHVGTTYPAIGSLANPMLDLSFNATSNGTGGTLVISFSADGFGPSSGSAEAAIGGTVAQGGANSLTYATYGGTNNTNFSTVNLLTSQGPFGPGAFSGTVTGGAVNSVGPYSLTQVITITHAAGTFQSTGDSLLTVPESGTSALLLGSGLMGIGLLARLRRRNA